MLEIKSRHLIWVGVGLSSINWSMMVVDDQAQRLASYSIELLYPSTLKVHDQWEFLKLYVLIEIAWKSQNHLHRETFASFFILTSKPYADCRYKLWHMFSAICSQNIGHFSTTKWQMPVRKIKY